MTTSKQSNVTIEDAVTDQNFEEKKESSFKVKFKNFKQKMKDKKITKFFKKPSLVLICKKGFFICLILVLLALFLLISIFLFEFLAHYLTNIGASIVTYLSFNGILGAPADLIYDSSNSLSDRCLSWFFLVLA
jgi:hypothetical protein